MADIISPQNDFYQKLKTGNIDNLETNFSVALNNSTVTWNFREFTKITFRELVTVSRVDIKSGLAFKNCVFEKGVVFKNVFSHNFSPVQNTYNCSVLFSGCTASFISFSERCDFERGIVIENRTSVNTILVFDTRITNAGIKIDESTVIDLIDIKDVDAEFKILSSEIKKNLRIHSLNGDVSYISSKFKGWVQIWNINCPNSLTFNNNHFESTFNIQASRIKGFFIHGDTFERKGALENRDISGKNFPADVNEIYITEAKFIEGFDFNGLGKSIEKITLIINPNFQGILRFVGWQVNNLNLSGINQNLKLLFKRMVMRFVLLNDFTNFNDIGFDKCNAIEGSSLNLSDCDLGPTKFNEFAFNTFTVIRADNVTLDKIKASNVQWFKDRNLSIEIANQTAIEEFRRRREVYRQIKQALKSSGNQIDSLIFQAREMQAYRNELNSSKDYNLGDKVIMSVNQTNDYGINWLKPFVLILLVTCGFYLIELPFFSNKINYLPATSWFDIKLTVFEFHDRFEVFWQMLNPARRFTTVYGEVDNGWLYMLDFFHRVILGILIYQLIKAFRKLVTK